jgi:hypothetical protein
MLLTWTLRTAVGACAVPRHGFDQLLQRSFIARLLALVQRRCHLLLLTSAPVATQGREKERAVNVHKGKHVGSRSPELQNNYCGKEKSISGQATQGNRGSKSSSRSAMTSNALPSNITHMGARNKRSQGLAFCLNPAQRPATRQPCPDKHAHLHQVRSSTARPGHLGHCHHGRNG